MEWTFEKIRSSDLMDAINWPAVRSGHITEAIDWRAVRSMDIVGAIEWLAITGAQIVDAILWPGIDVVPLLRAIDWPSIGTHSLLGSVSWPTISASSIVNAIDWPSIGGGGGGSWLPHRAQGGIARRPQPALVGEAGPEAIMPLSDLQRALENAARVGANAAPDSGGGDMSEVTDRLDRIAQALQRIDPSVELQLDGRTVADQSREARKRYQTSRVVSK